MHAAARNRAIAALLASLSCAGACAASFDCKQAKTPTEQAICRSAALSALDVRMAQSYQRALQALSPTGATALRASQRAWLRYVPQVCAPSRATDENCLTREWQDRIRRLDQTGLKLGALVLTRVDRYDAHRGLPGDDTGSPAGVVTHSAGHVQIDAATTPAELAWNRTQQPTQPPAEPRDADDDSNADVHSDATIACASERLLSIESTTYQYNHGAAHGSYATTATTVLLKAALRPLTAADLFAADSGWQAKLPTLFWQAHLDREQGFKTAEVEQAIRAAAADERRWLITPAGLRIGFSAYEGGSYAGTPAPITVAWPVLKPLLAGNAAPTCDFSFIDPR